jgi:hypothetical protein
MVERPQIGWWIAILGGLAMNAYVAFDGGAYAWWCGHVTTVLPQGLLQTVFIAAVLTHVAEATYAARLAQRSGLGNSAAGWFVQTLLLGFPSLRLLRRRTQP